ncbi:MAG TPA: WecB/TagA/CpsF family glycosyltransferase [Stellaceae bacterium]|nr:WecB/TagA/CpsF family glycosyltransferase [Stellaceae bacterium]
MSAISSSGTESDAQFDETPLADPSVTRRRFAGLSFTPVTVDQVVAAMAKRPANLPFAYFTTPNAEHAYWLRRLPSYADVIEHAWFSTCDSRILRRLAGYAGLDLPLAPGAYVVNRLFDGVIRPDDSLTIIGCSDQVVSILTERYGLTKVAHHFPPMGFIKDPAAVQAAIDFVAAHPARFVFIAMGPPHSDQLARQIHKSNAMPDGAGRLPTGIALCIGGALNTLSGDYRRCPDWMEFNGLVWLFRLWMEPRRLWRRYLVRSMAGVGYALLDLASRPFAKAAD